MKILKRLLPYARPLHHFLPEYIVYTFFGIVFGLLNFALLIPVLDLLFVRANQAIQVHGMPAFSFSISYFRGVFDHYFSSIALAYGKFGALSFVCILIAISISLSNIFRYLAVKVLIRLRLKMMGRLRNDIFDKYMHQSLKYHHDYTKGEGLMVLTSEVGEIESSVINALQVLLRDPFVVIAYFCMLLYWSVKLTLFTLIFLPLSGLIISSLTRKLKKLNYFSQDTASLMISFANECLNGIRQIQSFTSEKMMLGKFNSINDSFAKNSKKLFSKKEMATPISEILGVIAVLTLVLFGGYLIITRQTSLDGNGFIAYLALYTQMIQPLKSLSQVSNNLQRGVIACEKIFGVLDKPVDIQDKPNAADKKDFQQELSINNISFSYGDKDVIKNISLTVPKGKKVALVGSSGSGKSTLVDLICRFYDVQQGSITLDGNDIRDIKIKDLRDRIAIVSQHAFLFNDTIANNIALGSPGATQEQIVAAATIANAHEFILNTENGYDTMVGEGGVKLSGGQRQRITIARAVLKQAPILILDEATSSLDTESERLVQQAIDNLMQDRTSIVIAHRLSTVRHTDEIIVMQLGEIVERGTHEELMARQGNYHRLVMMQEVK